MPLCPCVCEGIDDDATLDVGNGCAKVDPAGGYVPGEDDVMLLWETWPGIVENELLDGFTSSWLPCSVVYPWTVNGVWVCPSAASPFVADGLASPSGCGFTVS